MRQRIWLVISAICAAISIAVAAVAIPQMASAGVSGSVGNGPMVIQSGTYTPTVTASINVTSYAVDPFRYSRVGDVVDVAGRFLVQMNANGGDYTEVTMSVPIASAMTGVNDLTGTGVVNETLKMDSAVLFAEPTTDRMSAGWYSYAANTTDQFWAVVKFSYVVK